MAAFRIGGRQFQRQCKDVAFVTGKVAERSGVIAEFLQGMGYFFANVFHPLFKRI